MLRFLKIPDLTDIRYFQVSHSSCDLRVKHSQVRRVLRNNQTGAGLNGDFVICKFNIHSGSGSGEPN